VGVEEPDDKRKQPRDDLLGLRNRLIVGAVFAAAYIATFGPRTGFLAAIISGVLGGVVMFLLLREVDARRKRRRR
jgi:fructose-specific phosphotransferase system IIC component